MKSLCLYLSFALWACHPQPVANNDTDLPASAPVECSPPSIIYDHLVRPPIGSVDGVMPSLPDSYYDAEKRFAVAATKFADHRFVDAARDFLLVVPRLDEAAQGFLVVTRRLVLNAQVDVFRQDRVIAYENAAFAYENARAFDEGRRELTQRAHQDPACTAELQRIVRDLNNWERLCKPVQ